MSRLQTILFENGFTDEEIETLISEIKPLVKLPKHHQFYTTYSRAGYFREDILRALSDAGCDYQEME